MSAARSRGALLAILLWACADRPPEPPVATANPALRDTLLTLFDSVITIHQAMPDTALIRRMHPAHDTIVFVEGPAIHRFTGDSLVRRVAGAHQGVTSMGPRIEERDVLLLGPDHALLTGMERVSWSTSAGSHEWAGLLTLVVARGDGRWTIRGYRH